MQNIPKQPVVVVMGHIDHGKSSLLDYIRKTNTTDREAGGITQHLGAYEAIFQNSEGKEYRMTFLDTPGHEAFSGIRKRGTNVADIAILVVSAEDGVKPQTIEALKIIKESKTPYVVAINKTDKPNANIEKTKINLSEHEVYLEGFGGDVPWVGVSAISGEGIPELLDTLALISDLEEFKAPIDKTPNGVIIEANVDPKRGISATIIIEEGILKRGEFVLSGTAIAPVRIFENSFGKPIKEAHPGQAVRITGFDALPLVGSEFISFNNKKEVEKTREIAVEKERSEKHKKTQASNLSHNNNHPLQGINTLGTPKTGSRNSYTRSSNNESDATEETPLLTIIPIILRADTIGSLEGVKHEINKIKKDNISIKIVGENLGSITVNDTRMAESIKNSVILGFNVNITEEAKSYIERSGITAKIFNIIYKLVEYIEELANHRKPKIKYEEITGVLKVLEVFGKNKDKQIIGGKVQSGNLYSGSEAKILRRETEIGVAKIRGIEQSKKKVDEVAENFECGLMIESKIEIAKGDRIQGFRILEK